MSQSTLDAALGYAGLGWPIFPTRHDKTPYTRNGVLDATTDLKQVRTWWQEWPGANIALAAGDAGLLVLDYDPGSDIDKARASLGGDLPETRLVSKTPRGGEHHYYALDTKDPPVASRAQPFAEKVDIRSFHGYVLLPPSRTRDGDYIWVHQGRPARRSDALLEACGRAKEKSRKKDVWTIAPDMPENVQRAREWLSGDIEVGNSRCRPAVEGQGGDNVTYATAAMCKSLGLSEGTALELMWEHFNPRCEPPWDYDELSLKVGNGYGYNTSPPGNVTPAYHVARASGSFAPVQEHLIGLGRQIRAGRFRLVDRPGLRTVSPPTWLVPGSIPDEVYVMLVGAPGSYKTFVALDLALTVATGGGALRPGWKGLWDAPRRSGGVLFAAGEGRSGLRGRVEAWEKHHLDGDEAGSFVLADPVPHIGEGPDMLIEAALKMRPDGYRLVVIDTVARAMQGVNENASENATALTRLVDTIRRELSCTVLAIHHTGHENHGRGRGSSAFIGDPDTILVSNREGINQATLSMTKQKDAEAWERPKWAKLCQVKLGDGSDSLASCRHEEPPKVSRDTARAGNGKLPNHIVDEAVMSALRNDPRREFSERELAEIVYTQGVDGDGQVSWGMELDTLRRTRITKLREAGSGARVQGMYDPLKRKWRYSPVAASAFEPAGMSG